MWRWTHTPHTHSRSLCPPLSARRTPPPPSLQRSPLSTLQGPLPCFSEPPTHSLLWVFGEPLKEPGSLGFLLLQEVLVCLDLWGCGNASLEPRNSVSSSALYHPVQGASKETFIPHSTLPAHQLQQGAVGRKVRNLTLWRLSGHLPPAGQQCRRALATLGDCLTPRMDIDCSLLQWMLILPSTLFWKTGRE